jgi:hypothetical protein
MSQVPGLGHVTFYRHPGRYPTLFHYSTVGTEYGQLKKLIFRVPDLGLLDSETYSTTPSVERRMRSARPQKVVRLIHLWRHVGCTVIGILPRQTPATLHSIGEGAEGTPDEWELPTNTNKSVLGELGVVSVPLKATTSDLKEFDVKKNLNRIRDGYLDQHFDLGKIVSILTDSFFTTLK